MPKAVSSFELTLKSRSRHQTLTNWLYGELRSAILEGRLAPGARLPASRDFASQYELSRDTVVSISPEFSIVPLREWSTDPRTTVCNGRSSRFNGTAELRLNMRQGWRLSKRANGPRNIRLAVISRRHVVRYGIGRYVG
jgi:hypothetical protein